jgi:hypothetical protein
MENDFLKMKLMLEHGASFHIAGDTGRLDPVLENTFLKHVISMEEMISKGAKIKISDHIGNPPGMKKISEIAEGEIEAEVERLLAFFASHGIHLITLSPNITPFELYRFMTEEFFDVEIPGSESPGSYCFVYDSFHPDPYYENEQSAIEHCIKPILSKDPVESSFPAVDQISLNKHHHLTPFQCIELTNQFKGRYTEIINLTIDCLKTEIRDQYCRVSGIHETGLCLEHECRISKGKWLVEFRSDNNGQWLVRNIQIEDINL